MYRASSSKRSSDEESSNYRGTVTRYCAVKEREDWIRANNPDFWPMPQIYHGTFAFQQPGALYRHYQIKANTTPISWAESSAYSGIAQQLERTAANEAVTALRHLHAILDFKAQAESKYDRPNQPQAHYKYHPVHGYLLDDSSDDDNNNADLIVDPDWDDFTLHTIRKFRPDIAAARKGRL
ncbi:hypothetical protein LXL04_004888 [Taraxacum kok-saghyz]